MNIRHDYAEDFYGRLRKFERYSRRLKFRWFCVGAVFMLALQFVLAKWIEVGAL
jgi:hypothetical protein